MKTKFRAFAILSVMAVIFLTSCKKEEQTPIEEHFEGTWTYTLTFTGGSEAVNSNISSTGSFSYNFTLGITTVTVSAKTDDNGNITGTCSSGGTTGGDFTGKLNFSGSGSGTFKYDQISGTWTAKKK